MRYAIVGAGAVGGMLGALLARAGNPVTVVLRAGSVQQQHPSSLTVRSEVLRSFTAPVKTCARLDETVDAVLIAVKGPSLQAAVAELDVGNATVVPFLNGIEHRITLQQRFGADRVLAGLVFMEVERASPGTIVHRLSQIAAWLAPTSRIAGRTDWLIDDFEAAGITTRVWDDAGTMLWTKLATLAPMALSTTTLSADLGTVRDDPHIGALLRAAVTEVGAIAAADGAAIDVEAARAQIETIPAAFRTSMQKDAAAGRPIEIDSVGRAVLRAAARLNVSAPATEELVRRAAEVTGSGD